MLRRIEYAGLPHIKAADARLATFLHVAGLAYEAPNEYTLHSANEYRRKVLDEVMWR